MAEVDDKRNVVTENLCSTSCIEKVFMYRSHNEDFIKEVTKLKYLNSEFLKNEELFKRKLDSERRDISRLKELLSDKESDYRDARRREKGQNWAYHNYSIMPNINTSVDDLLLKSDRSSEFCAESVRVSGSREKKEERSASRSIDGSTSQSKSHCVQIVYFVGIFESITIKPKEMIMNFKTKFTKIDDYVKNKIILESDPSPLTEQATQAHSTVTPETCSKLNPNFVPYVPTGSLEHASTSSISGLSDCDVKPFDPKEFHDKVCCYACGRPGHIARHCLHRPTEFFYGKISKVKPKAKPVKRPMRTDQSSKPRVKPQNVNQNHPTAKRAKPAKQTVEK
ncbi:hypothetical protein R6Q57_019683 [Mikania cordata]